MSITPRKHTGTPVKSKQLLAILAFFLSVGASAAPVTNNKLSEPAQQIYGVSLEYRLQEKGSTQYNALLMHMEQLGLKFNLTIRPLTRVIRGFKNHKGCMFPSSRSAMDEYTTPQYKHLSLIESYSVDYISLRVFTNTGDEKIARLEQLTGKRVGLWLGYDPNTFLKGINATIEITPSEKIRIKMLAAGRVDAIIGFTPDVMLAADALNVPLPHYDDALALFQNVGASLVCHDTPTNRVFITKFNRILGSLKKTGKLKEILGRHAQFAPK
jgi:ABC-type amino acid transport substrate-binding protein